MNIPNISIFAKPSFNRRGNRLGRTSSLIRAEQIAPLIGAKLNPASGFENDVCIYVKPHTSLLYNGIIRPAKNVYIDLIDGNNIVLYANKFPATQLIVCSQVDYGFLSRQENKVVFIPQQHCNFERVKRTRDKITTVGMIGANLENFELLWPEFEAKLQGLGLTFLPYTRFRNRLDVVNFYKNIDIQIVWRPWKKRLSNPLKLVNAASFGIPTIAFDEPALKELAGCYLPVTNLDEFMLELKKLIDLPELYSDLSKRCLLKAEKYHIDNVAKLYQKLTVS